MRHNDVAELERGELFFYCRPRVDVDVIAGLDDVGRFFLVTETWRGADLWFRVLVIGRKMLPAIVPGASVPAERGWALNVLATARLEDVRAVLGPQRYQTATRGERVIGPSVPVGRARYALVLHREHSELAYALEEPWRPGPPQRELGIQAQASYIIAVRNQNEKLGRRRWSRIDDPELLDHRGAHMVLIGARAGAAVEEDLGLGWLMPPGDDRRAI